MSFPLTENEGEITIFAMNRAEDDMALECVINGFGEYDVIEHIVMCDEDKYAMNDAQTPDRVVPTVADDVKVENGLCKATLKPLSWNVIRLKTINQ